LELGIFSRLFSSFLKILPFERLFPKLSSLKSFSSEFLSMTTQKVSTAFIGIVLVFEGRVLALEIFATGQQSL
jgi:hypothetical protein